MIENVYNQPTLPAPNISKQKLKEPFALCTTSVPLRNIDGKLYIQIDGMSLDSPFGPTFANFYMADLENQVINSLDVKPTIYFRFVDDYIQTPN